MLATCRIVQGYYGYVLTPSKIDCGQPSVHASSGNIKVINITASLPSLSNYWNTQIMARISSNYSVSLQIKVLKALWSEPCCNSPVKIARFARIVPRAEGTGNIGASVILIVVEGGIEPLSMVPQ